MTLDYEKAEIVWPKLPKKFAKQPKTDREAYDRHSITSLDSVLPTVREFFTRRDKTKFVINGEEVKGTSLRLRTFSWHGTRCACCGLQASYFALERPKNSTGAYHLNLWGVNDQGEHVLFTHDHIIARALGGKDHIDNTQTMCRQCNTEKGIVEGDEVKAIRDGETLTDGQGWAGVASENKRLKAENKTLLAKIHALEAQLDMLNIELGNHDDVDYVKWGKHQVPVSKEIEEQLNKALGINK